MYRTRKSTKQYNPQKEREQLFAKIKECPFCNLENERIVKSGKHLSVINNIYGYDMWDLNGVISHLLIVPHRHIEGISQMSDKEKHELIGYISEYESLGYNIYARELNNSIKSVLHQHVHLIKTDQKTSKFFLFIKKPYIHFRV
jgi:diadenosine tetraphosphate (Ap4A) HIT family hydrolase